MKSPFQKMLRNKLIEQSGYDILQDVGIDIDEVPPPRRPVASADDIPSGDEIPVEQDGDFNFETPSGAVHIDTNGNGEWDPGEVFQIDPPNGPVFNPLEIAVQNPDGSWGSRWCLTYNINGQDVAWVNGAWQCVGISPDGDPFLAENIWLYTGGWYVTMIPTGNPDMPFLYFMTQDNPWTNPDVEWWNPLLGNVPGTYPSWGATVGWQVGDFFGNIPLVPGGEIGLEDILPGYYPGMESEALVRLMMEFDWGDDLDPVGNRTQQSAWNAFWNWYFQTFGEYPPRWSWPETASWWKFWWTFPGTQEGYENSLQSQDR